MVRDLLERGAEVVAIVRDAVPRTFLEVEGLWPRISVCRGDVTDASLVTRVLAEYEIQTVLHLAAQTIVPIANRSPLSTFETNIAGTWTVLEAVRLERLRRRGRRRVLGQGLRAERRSCLTGRTTRSRAARPTTSARAVPI